MIINITEKRKIYFECCRYVSFIYFVLNNNSVILYMYFENPNYYKMVNEVFNDTALNSNNQILDHIGM